MDSGSMSMGDCSNKCSNNDGFRCCMASTYRSGKKSNIDTKSCVQLSNSPNETAQCFNFFPENGN